VTPRIGVVFRPQLAPERLRTFVTLADEVGLDDVWLWEDCFLEGGLAASTAALAWTGSVRLGLGLMPVPFRNPALAAMEIATLARLFPGRFVPAAGHGVLEWMDQVGARVASPMTLLREWVTAVRALLAGETVTAAGSYVRLSDVALAWPPDVVPPLLVGARGPRTIALAGECADGMVLDAGNTPDTVGSAVAQAAAPGPHEVVTYLPAGASAAPIEAEQAAYGRPSENAIAAGTPADVASVVRRFADAGATTVVLQPAASDLSIESFITLAAEARGIVRG
jgi:alkanesulfonate monooxygenase SsuD/methylene tetrahydromethanopterin reductase-like flavin-dependent oxidoreductase (luciferase family)